MQEQTYSQLISKYSHFLDDKITHKQKLLQLGASLFGPTSREHQPCQSYLLLQEKEGELAVPVVTTKPKINAISHHVHHRPEQPQPLQPEQLSEEIMVLQDKNALLLARRKALEAQKGRMNKDYGGLMEASVQTKVMIKLKMQKLKAELQEAISQSKPSRHNMPTKAVVKTQLMDELSDLNERILARINAFKMAVARDESKHHLEVMNRYKPKMESILGQIYAHTEYLPVSEVNERFNDISFTIEHELKDIETQMKSEHERNDQLQKEANQLADQLQEKQEMVNRLKTQNSQIAKEITILKDLANSEYIRMKEDYQNLLSQDNAEEAQASSARAMAVTSGNERKVIIKSPSKKFIARRDSAIPLVPPIEFFIEQQKNMLLEKINHAINSNED